MGESQGFPSRWFERGPARLFEWPGFVVAFLVFIATAACLPEKSQEIPPRPSEKTAFSPVLMQGLPNADDDMGLDRLSAAVAASLRYYNRLPAGKEFTFDGHCFSTEDARLVMGRLHDRIQGDLSGEALRDWLGRNFKVYAITGGEASDGVLYTGYYTPILAGHRQQSSRYPYPVYGRPRDLVTFRLSDFCESCSRRQTAGRVAGGKVVPYYSRADLQQSGLLSDTASPIVFVDDPVALFFLHVQGSGMVRLAGGGLIHVHYEASNGRPYKSIGKYLIESGKIPRKDISMQSIRAYLKAHPGQRDRIFAHNPRYVFFKEASGGAKGCLDVELTPGRSVAMDQDVFPPGILAFIQSRKPVVDPSAESGGIAACPDADPVLGWEDFSRFTLNQDTGNAISGPGHVDIFWGGGRYAEIAAGRMKHRGKLYVLMPKSR